MPRDSFEDAFVLADAALTERFPPGLPRILVTHTRPEAMTGILRRIDRGPGQLRAHGYLSRGGTLDTRGMLFANRCTWAHLAASAADLLGVEAGALLNPSELAAVQGREGPASLA
jgi:phosphoketolase